MGMGWVAKGLLPFIFLFASAFAADEFYDEVYFPNGTVRPQYVEVVKQLDGYSPAVILKLIKMAKKQFSGDTPMTPVPRLLLQSDFDLLAAGTAQRAETIRRFLQDHAGAQTYRDHIIPGAVIDAILDRTGERSLWKYITPKVAKKARFIYGPDVIRRLDGKYVVLEDNTGFVGSPGEIGPAREIYEILMPRVYSVLTPVNNPNDWYSDVQDRMVQLSSPRLGHRDTDGALVIFSFPPYGDKEDLRLQQIWKERGAIVVTQYTRDRRIIFEEDGAYVEFKGNFGKIYKKRIGFLWMNAEHAWADWQHPGIREKALVDEARAHLDEDKLSKKKRDAIAAAMERDENGEIDLDALDKAIRKSKYEHDASARRDPYLPGLVDAILTGKVQTNYTPGMEFIGDKMFHTYLDELTRFYLGQEPILPGAASRRFIKLDKKGAVETDQKNIEYALSHQSTSVIKIVDGRGGDSIFIGPKMTRAEWKALRKVIEAEPARYLVQEFSHPSVVRIKGSDDRIVDIRMISMIDETGKPLVSNTPWSRSNSRVEGDGKVNMSKNGTLMNVFVVPDPPQTCGKKLQKRGQRSGLN